MTSQDTQILTIPNGYYAAGATVEVRPRSSGVIALFDQTPPGIHCPHFWRISLGNGCRFGCAYCYLQGGAQHRVRKAEGLARIPILFTNLVGMQQKVARWLERQEPAVLNAGELSDSLDFSDYTSQMRVLIEMFARQRRHRLLALSKSANVAHLLDLDHRGQTILSWSINALEAASQFEGIASPVEQRIAAAVAAQDAGYPIRVRIDPMIPLNGWREAYAEVVQRIADSGLCPERWTLGTLRFLPPVLHHAFDPTSQVFEMVVDHGDPDARRRVPADLRVQMYRFAAAEIRKRFGPEMPIGLCKETEAVRGLVGIHHDLCNCTL